MEKHPLKSDRGSAKKKQKTSHPSGSPESSQPTTASSSDSSSTLPSEVTECSFPKTLATAKSLKSKSFQDIAQHLKVLNVAGISDLTWTQLKPALKSTKNLVDLDVMSTKIHVPDLIEIVKIRPTLKSIAMTFSFGHKKRQIDKKLISKLQQAFRGFENVKFLGAISETFRLSELALQVLKKAKLNNLTFILDYNYNKSDRFNSVVCKSDLISIKQLQVYYLRDVFQLGAMELAIFNCMDFNDYEIIILEESKNHTLNVYATPCLKEIICEGFPVDVETLSNPRDELIGKLFSMFGKDYITLGFAVMFWNRNQCNFDETFKSKLFRYLKEYLVFNVKRPCLTQVPSEFQWYGIEESTSDSNDQTQSNEIDYGKAFKDKEDIKLNIKIDESFYNYVVKPIANNFDFMKKMSHLFLYKCDVKYKNDSVFFDNLFEQCHSLVTLQIAYLSNPTALQSIGKSKSLKNIYLDSYDLDNNNLLSQLSECPSLENIVLVDMGGKNFDESRVEHLFEKCKNLYNFCMQFDDYDEDYLEEVDEMCRSAKSEAGRDALNIEVMGELGYRYSPHLSVFNLSQLRPTYLLDILAK